MLEGILDYAGLFPPAKLDMAPTVRNFDAYRRGPDAWFLGRLVVPVARLAEFELAAESLLPASGPPGDDDDAWPITALTAPAGVAEANDQFARDLDLIAAFNERHAAPGAGSAIIDCIEVRAASSVEIDRAIDLVPDDLFPYFELSASADPRGLIATLAGLDAGAKIRTGGVTADAHPSPEEVARFIVACSGAEVPFKATAGLHHPLRHSEASVGCRQHGFLNVFVGAALVWHGKIDERAFAELLAEESATALTLRDDAISWRSTHVSAGELRATRDAFAHSFGSCSFDEPLADLRAMRALAAAGANA